MDYPKDSALAEIVGNQFFLRQWQKDISSSEDLKDFYRFCVIGLGSSKIPNTELSYFEVIEVHAKCCVFDYRLRFPHEGDRDNYQPRLLTKSYQQKIGKQKRVSNRPSDRKKGKNKSKNTKKTVDNSTIDLLV